MSEYLSQLFNGFFAFAVRCRARLREARRLAREARRRQALHVRPRLEWLDERIVPAIDTYIGAAGGAWTAAPAWSLGTVPGSMDTADIPAGKYCVLSGTTQQTVAGLTVEGQLDVSSKLSVTTTNTASNSIFNLLSGGELDVLGSADFGGKGSLAAKVDSSGSTTFDPGSGMSLDSGVQLIGPGVYNIYGAVTVTTGLTQTSTMVLDDNGSTTAGSLTGPGSLSESGEFDWNGGTLGLVKGADFIASADLKIQGSGAKTLSAGTVTN